MADGEGRGRGSRILVGVVGAPHGVRGECRIKSYMATPTAIGDHPLFTAVEGGPPLRLHTVRALKEAMVVGRLEGVGDRDAAAAMTGRSLYIDRTGLPPAEEDEFYHADLVGLAVRSEAGLEVGTVVAVVDYGGGDLLEIAVPAGGTLLVPFLMRFVPVIDIAGGVVTVTEAALAPEAADDASEGDTP